MTATTIIPKIPDWAEYVACPECKRLGFRLVGTDLLCPDCEVSAVVIDAPDCIPDLPCDVDHDCRGAS